MENANIEQQIAQLEQQLQEKKAALEQQPTGQENNPSDKEVLHEIIGERIQQQAPSYTPQPQPAQTNQQQSQEEPSYLSQELKDKIQELINLVFMKDLDEGIKGAVNSNNAALIDAFHDVLVDELYGTLLERKKVSPIK